MYLMITHNLTSRMKITLHIQETVVILVKLVIKTSIPRIKCSKGVVAN